MNQKLLGFLLTLLITTNSISSSCEEGCLSCGLDTTGNPICEICDVHNSYRLLSSGKCIKWMIENCEVPSANPSKLACNLCMPGYSLNNPGNRCSPVPQKYLVPDCKRYHWEYSCLECMDGFYLTQKKCKPISTPIENCRIYVDPKTCSECNDGYFHHIGTGKCEEITKKSECLVYSSVECTECSSGHFQVDSLSSGASLSNDFVQSLTKYSQTETSTSAFYETKSVNNCVLGTVEHCSKHLSFNSCLECANGYFLSPSKTCVSDPIRTVAHCEAYQNANECIRCTSGYYLEKNVCRELSSVNGCLEFDPVTEDCVKCDQEKYYLDEGFCGSRNKSQNISYCQETSDTDDHCVKCLSSFQLTDDKLNCLPHIPHCKNYVTGSLVTDNDYTNENTVSLKCLTCDDYFYLMPNKKECIPQDSVGCLTFTVNTNICTACASGYYLESDACTLYTKKFCKTFSPTSDECASCFDGYFLLSGECNIYTAKNCLTYETALNDCATCHKHYYLKTDSVTSQKNCHAFTAKNCKEYTGTGGTLVDSCSKCFQGYSLEDTINCIPISLLNCAIQSHETNSCTTCKEGYFLNGSICEAYTARNCASYNPSANECATCEGITTSGLNTRAFYKTSDNKCLPYTVMNCATKVDDEDKCATCTNSTDWYINAQGECIPSHLNHCSALAANTLVDECQTCLDGFKLVSGKCFKLEIPGCLTYSGVNCSSCAAGFYLLSNKCHPYSVSNCATYETASDKCATCVSGYLLVSNICELVEVDFCAVYDQVNRTCNVCETGYYLNTTNCDPQSISGCAKYKVNKNECEECRFGFTTTLDTSIPAKTICEVSTSVKGCLRPLASDNAKCELCYRGYVLNATTQLCTISAPISDCIQYELSTGNCEVCIQGKQPNANMSACEAITTQSSLNGNCRSMDIDTGFCKDCNFGYYLSHENNCQSQNISNCITYKPNKNECLQCKEGTNKVGNSCELPSTIDFCIHYTPDRTSCLICRNNYYPVGNRCAVNNLINCRVKKLNQRKCEFCEDNYDLGLNEDCGGKIQNPYDSLCLEYDTTTNVCSMCKKGNQLVGGVCTAFTILAANFQLDSVCVGTDDDDSICDFCPQGNKSFPLQIVKMNDSAYTGCAKIDLTSGFCTQCLPGYDTPSSTSKTCSLYSGSARKCLQLKENATDNTTLDAGTDCIECFNKKTHWLDTNTCTESEQNNIEEMTLNANTVKYCKEGSSLMDSGAAYTQCLEVNTKNYSELNTLTNCEIWDKASNSCHKCVHGYENVSGPPNTCTKTNTIENALYIGLTSSVLEVTDSITIAANADVVAVQQIDSTGANQFIPIMCADGKIRQLEDDQDIFMNYPPVQKYLTGTELNDYIENKIEFAGRYPKFDCIDWPTDYWSDHNAEMLIHQSTERNKCNYWSSSVSHLYCRGCVDGFYPLWAVPSHKLTNNTPTADTTSNPRANVMVKECLNLGEASNRYGSVGVNNLQRNYQGFEIESSRTEIAIPWINYDSCSDGSALVVFGKASFGTIAPEVFSLLSEGSASRLRIPPITCMPVAGYHANFKLYHSDMTETIAQYNLPTGIENCQINYFIQAAADTGTDIDVLITQADVTNTVQRFGCLACMPNHSPITHADNAEITTTSTIAACSEIANCNLSGGTWMNACETCTTNYGWEVSANWVVLFQNCVTFTNITNCLMFQNDTAPAFNCVVCKEGYLLTSENTCVNTMDNCDTIGLTNSGFSKHATLNTNFLIFNFMIRKLLGGPQPKYCKTCPGSSGLAYMPDPGAAECTFNFTHLLNLTSPNDSASTDCLVFGATKDICVRCKTTHFLDSSNTPADCTLKSGASGNVALAGCESSADGSICSTCIQGYLSINTGSSDLLCYTEEEISTKFNCDTLDASTPESETCKICKPGYVFDDGTAYICKERTTETCDQGTNSGNCLKCAEPNHFPINFKNKPATTDHEEYSYVCAPQFTSINKKLYLNQIIYNFNDDGITINESFIPKDGFYKKITDKSEYGTETNKTYKDRCINVRAGSTKNCTNNSENDLKCISCEENFSIQMDSDAHNRCVPNIKNCMRFKPNTQDCEICDGNYFMDPDTGFCFDRTHNTSEFIPDPLCAGNNTDGYGCDECTNGNKAFERLYMDTTTANGGCLESNPADGNCKLCEPNFDFVNGSATCTANSGTPACYMLEEGLTSSTALNTDDCLYCNDGNILHSDNTCKPIPSTIDVSINSTDLMFATTVKTNTCQNNYKKVTSATTKNTYECAQLRNGLSSPKPDCLVHTFDGDCALCIPGKSGASCAAVSNSLNTISFMDTNLQIQNNSTAPATDKNDQYLLNQQIDLSNTNPVQCNENYRFKRIAYSNTTTDPSDYASKTSYKPKRDFSNYQVNTSNDRLAPFPSYPIYDCLASSIYFKYFSDSATVPDIVNTVRKGNSPTALDCAYWWRSSIQLSSTTQNSHKCMRCLDGYIPVMAPISQVIDDGTFGEEAFLPYTPVNKDDQAMIKKCILATDNFSNAQKAYEGLGYHSKAAFPWGAIISIDHCNASDEVLVVFVDINSGAQRPTLTYVDHTFGSSGITDKLNHVCAKTHPTDATDFFAATAVVSKYTTTINNCQINISEVVSGAVITEISPTMKCAACRPGYRPFINANHNIDITNTTNYINQCHLIDNCASDGLEWMNACSKCDTGYAWFWDNYASGTAQYANVKMIQFHNCVATPITNCLVVNNNNTADNSDDKCLLCKFGYYLTHTGTCESVDYLKYKNCQDFDDSVKGFMSHDLEFDDSKAQSQINLFYMQYFLDTNSIKHTPYCVTCKADYHLIKVPSTSNNFCSNNIYYTDWVSTQTALSTCETWDITNLANCATCTTGNVLVAGDYTSMVGTTCQDISARKLIDPFIENCMVVSDTTNYHCTKCKPSFYEKVLVSAPSNTYRICYNFQDYFTGVLNCVKFNFASQECQICEKGYEFDTDNPLWCKPSTGLNDTDCNQKTKDDFCLSCHGENYFPIHFKKETPANTYEIKCIDQGRNLSDELFMIPIIFDLKTNKMETKTDQIPFKNHFRQSGTWSEYNVLVPNNRPEGIKNVKNICLNVIHNIDCIESKDNGYKCSKCVSGKGLFPVDKDYNVCSSDCGEINPHNGLCVRCADSGKFLNSDRNACSDYTFSSETDCEIKSPFFDGCLYCKTGFYLMPDQSCVAYTPLSNCMTRDLYSNKCTKCNDGYNLDLYGNCLTYTLSNCRYADPEEFGSCLACEPGYELIHKKCVFIDAMSMICKSRDTDGNCASCFSGYTLSNGNCEVAQLTNQIEGCINYDHHGYLCVECNFHLILTNGVCKGKNIEYCKVLSEDQSHCLVCEDLFFLKGYTCSPRTNLNCLVAASDEDKCLSCPDMSYLKNHKCHPYSANGCKTYSKIKDQCLTCQDGYYLDPISLVCVRINLNFCQSKNYLKNECYACTQGYFLDTLGLCQPRINLYCAMFDPFEDSCLECDDSHFLKTSSTVTNPGTVMKGTCKPYTVENCDSYSPIDNICLSCAEGFYMKGALGCLARTSFNCSAWNNSLTECISCPSGTYLEMGICNSYTVSNCASYDGFKDTCLSCSPGFYLQQKECIAYTLSDCENFKADKDECQKCMPGFYLRNGTCEAISQNNCYSHSSDKNECNSCETGYYLQNGACLTYTISCMDYSPSSNECLSCPKGQYLEHKNSTCINYTVENCSTYSFDKNECETCVPNYYYKNGLCLPYTVTNCKVYHSLFDECVTCKDNFYHHKQWCIAYNVINCATYSPVSDLCLTCKEGHYNKNGNCLPYTALNCGTFFPDIDYCKSCESNQFYKLTVKGDLFKCKSVTPVENCETYYTYEDKCLTCENNFYLVESTNTCHEVPETVSNCQEFIDAQNCKTCIAPYFLQNNECIKSDHIIDKCVKYESNTKCLECDGANILSSDSTLCLKTTESSCETYLDPSNCKTCAGNTVINYIDDSSGEIVSGLNGEDLSSLRSICNNSGIMNCSFARSSFPENTCLQCNANYFLASSSSCQIVNETINNCEIYFADGICSQCENNHVLSTDKKQCNYDVTFLGANCQSGKFFTEPKCFLCKSGFYFNSKGDCTACAMEGCAVCTEDASASCRLCKKDFYMNSEMKCISNGTVSRLEKEVADDGLLSSGFLKESGFVIKIMNILAIPTLVLLFVQRIF